MSDSKPMSAVKEFVAEHEPVEQDEVVDEFGRRGLTALRTLMRRHEVSYSLDWRLVTE